MQERFHIITQIKEVDIQGKQKKAKQNDCTSFDQHEEVFLPNFIQVAEAILQENILFSNKHMPCRSSYLLRKRTAEV